VLRRHRICAGTVLRLRGYGQGVVPWLHVQSGRAAEVLRADSWRQLHLRTEVHILREWRHRRGARHSICGCRADPAVLMDGSGRTAWKGGKGLFAPRPARTAPSAAVAFAACCARHRDIEFFREQIIFVTSR